MPPSWREAPMHRSLVLTTLLIVSGCAQSTAPAGWSDARPPAEAMPAARVALDWEAGHPERAAWSDALLADLNAHYDSLVQAADAVRLHPQWPTLSRAQRLVVLAELFVWTAYYESNWNPSDFSLDVGNRSDRDTWSVGLLQLSVVDQANHDIPLGYSFADLQDSIKNIRLGVAILARQIDRHGKILIPAGESGVYWSTLHPGGKYDKSGLIELHTRSLTFPSH
jgi:Transglycosylase SLT domain